MYRLSRMKTNKAVTFLLFGAFLVVVYLCINVTNHKAIHLQDVKNDCSQTKAPAKTKSYVNSWPRCQQHFSVESILDFPSLSADLQNFLYYRHCRHFPMLLDIPDKCGGPDEAADIFLLLVIKSSPKNYDCREVLRKTWAKERLHNGAQIQRVFITGTMGAGLEKERLNKLLELEQRKYNDILQWDINDCFYNLTLKETLFLEWMERNCQRAPFLLIGDDDVFANTDNMVEYLQSLKDKDGSKHLFAGYVFDDALPIRQPENKYFVPFQLYKSNFYPPFCSGGGILMSTHTALVIYKMSKSITILHIDDVFLAMCLAKAGLSPTHLVNVHTLGDDIPSLKDKYDPCIFKEMLLVHRLLPANMYAMWQRIHDPNLKCATPKKWPKENQAVDFRW